MVAIDPRWAPEYVQRVLDVEKEEGHTICGAPLTNGAPCRKWASSTIGRCLKHADEQTIEQFFARQPVTETAPAAAPPVAAPAPGMTPASAPAPAADTVPELEPALEFPRKRSRQVYFWVTINVLLVLVMVVIAAGVFPSLRAEWGKGDEQLFAQGEKLYGENNYKMALEQYRRLLDEYPHSELIEMARTRRDECLTALERQNYETIISMQPDSNQAREAKYKLAETLQGQGQFQEAVATYEEYLAGGVAPDSSVKALYQISACYQQLGQYAPAIDTLKQLLERYPGSELEPEIMFAIGHIYQQTDDRQNAILMFEKVRAQAPSSKWAGEAAAALSEMR
ncbi:MAG TPA: tetratricopeptide repeat protein [bacterium]|nr:tetratricopeptide repeat protein [bacterium]